MASQSSGSQNETRANSISVFNAKSISFEYDRVADRIALLLGDHALQNFHRAWMSRRYLKELLPEVSAWLKRNSPMVKTSSQPMSKQQIDKVSSFEHSSAKQQIEAQQGKPEATNNVDAIVREYLLKGLRLNEQDGKVVLVFVDSQDVPISGMKVSRSELHKIVSCMLDVSSKAGWDLPSPWESTVISHSKTQH